MDKKNAEHRNSEPEKKDFQIERWFRSAESRQVIETANRDAAETRKKLLEGRRIEGAVLGRRFMP